VYSNTWFAWWRACQPPWRQSQEWPFQKEAPDTAKWGKLAARGQNGMFLVIMSTTWWALSLKSANDQRIFGEAVDDIHWVVKQVLKQSFSTTNTTQDPSPEPSPTNAPPMVTWMTRTEGKRRPKPSRALLQSME
jgi:hypothetical protein